MTIILRGKYIDRSKEEVGVGGNRYIQYGQFHWLWMVSCNEGMSYLPNVSFWFFVFHEYHFCLEHCVNIPITINNHKKEFCWEKILNQVLFNMYYTLCKQMPNSREMRLLPFFSTPDFNKMTSTFLSPRTSSK